MRLVKIRIAGFRRFKDATLNLDADLIAIVGPNEAGKSSLLQALTYLNPGFTQKVWNLVKGGVPSC